MDRLNSVAYGYLPGDTVDIMLSFTLSSLDQEFQTLLFNSATFFLQQSGEEGVETASNIFVVDPIPAYPPTPTPDPDEPTPTPGGGPPPTPTPPPPEVVLIALPPQQQLFLKYAVETTADIDFALRSTNDGQLYSVQQVDAVYLLEQFGITIPPNSEFARTWTIGTQLLGAATHALTVPWRPKLEQVALDSKALID